MNYAISFFIPIVFWGLVWGIICAIITASKGYKGWDVYSGFQWGFFLNIIGFIVVLCKPSLKKEKIMTDYINVQTELLNQVKEKNELNGDSNTSKIYEYKKLLDDGIISEEEFNAKKKELLGL